eukprot:Skav233287  [mRNA]  locus=scaffold4120:120998:134385:- [translate_table: standard]
MLPGLPWMPRASCLSTSNWRHQVHRRSSAQKGKTHMHNGTKWQFSGIVETALLAAPTIAQAATVKRGGSEARRVLLGLKGHWEANMEPTVVLHRDRDRWRARSPAPAVPRSQRLRRTVEEFATASSNQSICRRIMAAGRASFSIAKHCLITSLQGSEIPQYRGPRQRTGKRCTASLKAWGVA